MLLSVIIPMLNEEEMAPITYARLSEVLKGINHELIFIDDGSTDHTLKNLNDCIAQTENKNKVVSFSRNFGHQAAFSAGLHYAQGDAVVIIDGDLQDPPELIHEMLEKWNQGYQVVYAQRRAREGETFFKLFTAKAFYRIHNTFTKVKIPVDTGDYRLMDRVVVDTLKALPERSRFLRGLVPWVGFKQIGVQYDRAERTAGETKYPLSKMLRLAADGITSFSTSPLKVSFYIGFISMAMGFILGVWAVISKLMWPETTTQGWASLIIAIIFMGGAQLVTIGILGEYIGRIYEEVKQRPLFLVNKVHEKGH
jgi:glycosyltransferase involved in cell wall biosynthesis